MNTDPFLDTIDRVNEDTAHAQRSELPRHLALARAAG